MTKSCLPWAAWVHPRLLPYLGEKVCWLSPGGWGGHLVTITPAPHGSHVAQMVKNLPANAGNAGDESSIPGSGRFP